MTSTNITQRLLWLGAIIIAVVLADQLVKQWIVDWIGPGQAQSRIEMLGSVVALEYLENRGAAFGLFQQGTLVLASVSVIIVAIGLIAMVRFAREDFLLAASVALILGGATGNAIDRFSRGYVVDFIAVGRFWKFNLADSAITVGVLLTLLLLWRADSAESRQHEIQEQDT